MTSKIKALGLAFVAIAAMSAMAASAAQAGSIDVGAQPAIVSGHDETGQDHTLVLQKTSGTPFPVTCQTAWIEGTTVGQQNLAEVTATATYGGHCTFLGNLQATVRLNGCKYTLTGAGQDPNTALADVTGCTQEAEGGTPYITIQVTGCQLRIPEQHNLSHVVGTTITGPPDTVTLAATVQGITVHQVGLACPDGNGHKGTRAAFQGNTTIKATQEDGSVQVQEHNHQFTKFNTSGTQVNLTST